MLNLEDIERLEECGLWQSALQGIAKSFEQRPDRETAIRLLFVSWYVLVEWPCIDSEENLDNDLFEFWLKKVSSYLVSNYSSDSKVNFYHGYMISISPWFFSKDVDFWEKRASNMLARAAQSEPDNPIYQMVYLANTGDEGNDYKHYCEIARPIVKDIYSGKGEFNQYFRDVLSR